MSNIRYLYAFNNECGLTDIKNAKRNVPYFCPLCTGEMIPRQGRKNKWHYAHKNMAVKCSYESYLHKIAKELICDHINNTNLFKINYCVTNHCNLNCSFNLDQKCRWISRTEFNLLDYYDTCEIEAEYKGYRADLLLCNKHSPSREPIFIEIYVNHPCSQEKIESNIRIIEIKIESEEDINRIINKSIIYESDGYIDYTTRKDDRIKFYNFKKDNFSYPKMQTFPVMNYWGISNYNNYYKAGVYNCLDTPPKYLRFLIISRDSLDWIWCMRKAINSGIPIKSCKICKYYSPNYYDMPICCLYKKYGTPQYPKANEARACKYYRICNFNDSIDQSTGEFITIPSDYKVFKDGTLIEEYPNDDV